MATSSSQRLGNVNDKVHALLIVEYGSLSWHALLKFVTLFLEHILKEIIASVST